LLFAHPGDVRRQDKLLHRTEVDSNTVLVSGAHILVCRDHRLRRAPGLRRAGRPHRRAADSKRRRPLSAAVILINAPAAAA